MSLIYTDRPDGVSTSTFGSGGLPAYRRAGFALLDIQADKDKYPASFPVAIWQNKVSQYIEWWDWFTGKALLDGATFGPNGERYEKYPLRINIIEDVVRKRASLIFGDPPASADWVVRSKIDVKNAEKRSPQNIRKAQYMESLVHEVWEQSGGAALVSENATISQILGGCYFEIEYKPYKATEYEYPIFVSPVMPDFVVPIWESNMWDLSECWIVYRIPAKVAQMEYGIDIGNDHYAIYAKHWKKDSYSIWINNKPLVARHQLPFGAGEMEITYENVPNPFGFVPVYYIPRMREGDFYGPSIVPSLQGLAAEFNDRFADIGDIVQQTAHRRWFGRNLNIPIEMREFDGDQRYAYLGQKTPGLNTSDPEIWSEDPPAISQHITDNIKMLWQQILRQSGLTHVHYGEDEGSQRSGETLALRSWPAVSIAKIERTFWSYGLNRIAKGIVQMAIILGLTQNMRITLEELRDYSITQQWHPMIERNRESMINEIVQLRSIGDMSLERSLEMQGSVIDIDTEKKMIEMEQRAKLEQQLKTRFSPPPPHPQDENPAKLDNRLRSQDAGSGS